MERSADGLQDDDPLLDALVDALLARQDREGDGGASGTGPWEALRRDLAGADRLLKLHRAGSAPERPAGEAAEPDPGRIGRFEVLGRIGSGGFGIVYRARDPKLDRVVALKIPHPGRAASAEVRQRFLREARAVANLDHPNIVPLLEMEEAGAQLYIASTYCDGVDLARWIEAKGGPFPPRQAAQLVEALAGAVAHAHGRGIFHRDIKPSNVLLQVVRSGAEGGRPEFLPRLTDFGLARIASESLELTDLHATLGTPAYVPPEQINSGPEAAGPAIDVYGLGATLYELLAGVPPFRGSSPTAILFQVVANEPESPRRLRPEIPRDLETICLKCLEKDPARRYPSAIALREDLDRFLKGDRIEARPRSALSRAWRWSRRRPALAGALVAAPAIALAASLTWLMYDRLRHNDQMLDEARTEARQAAARKRSLDWASAIGRIRRGASALGDGQIEEAQDILDAIGPTPAGDDPRGFAWSYLQREARRVFSQLRVDGFSSERVALSADGRALACGVIEGEPGKNKLFALDYPSGAVRHQLIAPLLSFRGLAISDRGRWVAADGDDGAVGGSRAYLWDAESGRLVREWAVRGEILSRFGFFAGDRVLAVACDRLGGQVLRLWDLVGEAEGEGWPRPIAEVGGLSQMAWGGGRIFCVGADGRLMEVDAAGGGLRPAAIALPAGAGGLAVSGDGRWLAVHEPGKALLAWDLQGSGGPARLEFGLPVVRLAVAPGGAVAAFVGDGTATIWDPPTGRTHLLRLIDHPRDAARGGAATAEFSPDGSRLATCFDNPPQERPRLWDVATGRLLAVFPGTAEFNRTFCFAEGGRSLLFDGVPPIRRWKVVPPPPLPSPSRHGDEVWALAFSPDSELLVSAGNDTNEPRPLKSWDVATGELIRDWKGHTATVTALAFHPDGRGVVSGSLDGAGGLLAWEPRSGADLGGTAGSVGIVRSLAFSPGGELLASGGRDGKIRLWDYATFEARRILANGPPDRKLRSLAFSPDGALLAAASEDHFVRIWDLKGGDEPAVSVKLMDQATALAFLPSGDRLYAADRRGVITPLDPRTGEKFPELRGESQELLALAIDPDGRTLAAAGLRKVITLWDVESGQDLMELQGHAARINALAWSPDGHTLASGDHAGAIRLWRGGPLSPGE